MVFFTCNACGQSVKKAQVEKHYMTQCRSCEVLSCMDCGKDFVGDAYKTHTKCVSENEKYGGKNYQAPANKGNKGEAKQEQWLQRVREAKDSAKLSPAVAKLLDRIAEYPNVPRKQKKFENFVYNSLRVPNKSLVAEVWKIFSEAGTNYYKELMAAKPNNNNETKPHNDGSDNNDTTPQSTNQLQEDNTADQSKDSQLEPSENNDQSQNSKKKKKKDKSCVENETNEKDENCSKKTKIKKCQGDPEVQVLQENGDISGTFQNDKKHKKKKQDQKHVTFDIETKEQAENHSKKKKKKKCQGDPEMQVLQENGDISGTLKMDKKHKKKSGKRKQDDEVEEEEEDCTTQKKQRLEDPADENEEESSTQKKFKWNKIIISVLENSDDHQLPIKKLRKKVLNEFHACGGDVRIKSNEQLRATFEKKVKKSSNFKVHKEIVKLNL